MTKKKNFLKEYFLTALVAVVFVFSIATVVELELLFRSEREVNRVAYQVAYKYAKSLKNKQYIAKIREKYAQSYIDLADSDIEKNSIQEAISDLKNSIKIKDSAVANYKLGIVYINVDKTEAEKYFAKVFKKYPFMVNPYIYNKLLNDLITESKTGENLHNPDYYILKLNSFKKSVAKYYLYKEDITIKNSHILPKKQIFSKEKRYNLLFDIENNTKEKIDDLFMEIELFVGTKSYKINKKYISNAKPLDFYELIEQVKVELPKDFQLTGLKDKHEIIIKYFAKKNKRAPWTLLKIDSLNI